VAICAEQVAQFLIRIPFVLKRRWAHNKHSVHKLITMALNEIGPVELARRHQRARRRRAEQPLLRNRHASHACASYDLAPSPRASRSRAARTSRSRIARKRSM